MQVPGNKEELTELARKYTSGEATQEEMRFLEMYYDAFDKQGIPDVLLSATEQKGLKNKIQAVVENRIGKGEKAPIPFLRTAWFRYAAIVLIMAGAVTFLFLQNKDTKIPVARQTEKPDILPGGNKAVLTLADGTTIELDNASNGSLAQQGNTKVIKLDAGSLAYNTGATAADEVLYNTITTPRGGQYQVTLSDGSRVWLNAASSIRFPTAFAKERAVQITGEVYLEIEQDKSRPFLVNVGDVKVLVLGTSFNVNAYPEEGTIKTTLIEGSVRVNARDRQQKLLPGQQAQLTETGDFVTVKADLGKVMAWKNGFFNFKDADLPTVMRQLERWYDIRVKYEGAVPAFKFQGELERGLHLSQVLKILGDAEVKFRQEGRSLIILQ